MTLNTPLLPLIDDELDVLSSLVPVAGQRIIELGCGAAALARALLSGSRRRTRRRLRPDWSSSPPAPRRSLSQMPASTWR